MRIDKFLWCVRLARTRSEATRLCNQERVMLDGQLVKPSKVIYPNVKIALKVPPIWKTFEVLDIPPSRVGAKLVSGLLLETTSAEDLEKLSLIAQANRENRALGIKGRPTKKDRRKLDGFQG